MGYIWAGTYAAGLNRYNPSTQEIKRYSLDPNNPRSLGFKNVWAILEDYNNDLWFGLLGGLAHYNRDTEDFTHYKNEISDSSSLSNNIIIVLYEDSKKNFWVGTQGGLNLFDKEKGSFKRFLHEPKNANAIINNNIRALHEDKNGNLWIGTQGGMSIMNLENHQISTPVINELLPNLVINGILEDEDNNLWISTNDGLFSYNTTSNEIQRFSKSDGLQGNEFNYTSSVKSKKTGTMYFGGLQGLNSFSPENVEFSTINPKIAITDFKIFGLSVSMRDSINGKLVIRKSLPYLSKITLSHKESIFSIEFASLDYTSPSENKYRYKLEGFDEFWNNTDALRRTATYMNLPPDDYVLTIQGTNSDGIWSNEERTLAIKILPPFWKTWWFQLLSVVIVIAISLLIHFSRIRVLNEKRKKLNLMVKERTEIIQKQIHELSLRNKELDEFAYVISHDLKAPLRGIANLSQWISADYKEKLDETGVEYLDLMVSKVKKLETLINDVLEYSRTGKSERVLKKVNLNDVLNDILNTLEVPDNFTIEIENLPEVEGVESEWYQIFQNIMSNAIKYNDKEEGTIKIYCDESEGKSIINVLDNGIGISKKHYNKVFEVFQTLNEEFDINSTGIGLATVKKLVELNNSKIYIKSELGENTCFSIELASSILSATS